MKQLNTYIIEGGIGKCTAFTSLIPKLVEKAGQPIQIWTPYVNCFAGNPGVKMAFEQQTIPLNDPRILQSDNIHYCEPYKSNFVFGKEHIIESYCKLFDVPYDKDMKPVLYTDEYQEAIDKWLEENNITGQYMLVQFTGGQTPVGFNEQNQYISSNPGRNYHPHLAQEVINKLKERYPSVTILDVTLPNEPSYLNTIKCPLPWPAIHQLLKSARGFICIDTCLNHFSACIEKKGVVIWGNTRWTQFGYDHNINLHYHMDNNQWNDMVFNENDPRNTMIDPEKVFRAYVETQGKTKNK